MTRCFFQPGCFGAVTVRVISCIKIHDFVIRTNVKKVIYTIGHSTLQLREFIALLKAYQIDVVADIRSVPHSAFNPQFNQENLEKKLQKHKIRYVHFKELGGFRRPLKKSLNLGWKNASFRGYADYMQTSKFWKGIAKLVAFSSKKSCALMCAEALPWRCHRSLIADALTLKKWKVFHILSKKTAHLHTLTPFLHRVGTKTIYALNTKAEKNKKIIKSLKISSMK